MKETKHEQFAGLNSLRFFAALSIIIYHAMLPFANQMPATFKMFLHNLPIGVDLFFLISGFLIINLLLMEKSRYQNISLKNFYIRRVLRIFPLYFLIIFIALAQNEFKSNGIDFKSFVFFYGNFSMIAKNSWTISTLNPLWSLSIEEHFYLVIPLLILLIPARRLNIVFASVVIGSIVFRIYASYFIEWNWMSIYLNSLSRCDLMAIGGLIAFAYQEKKIVISIGKWWIILITVFLLIEMCMFDNFDYTNLFRASFGKYIYALPLLAILLLTTLNSHGSMNNFGRNRSLNYLGKISYGLYMFHTIVIDFLNEKAYLRSNPLLITSLGIVLTILIAVASYELFEKRILNLKSRFEIV